MRTVFVKIQGNLTAAVAEPDHENALTTKRFAVAVFATVQDAAAEALLARPGRHVEDCIAARRRCPPPRRDQSLMNSADFEVDGRLVQI